MVELKQESIVKKIDYLHTQAVAKHKEGKLEEAIDFYLESIELDESQPAWIYGNVITLLAQVGRFNEGLGLGEKAEKLYPESDEVYRASGIIYQKQNNLTQALNYFQKAIELNPLQPEWLYSQILEYTTSEAIKIQDELVNVESESYLLNLDSQQPKNPKKAELKPESIAEKIGYLHTQAVAKHKEGKLEEAIDFYLESIAVEENQPAWIYGNVITLLAEVGRWDEGLELGEKAEKLHPESDEVYRAIYLLNLGYEHRKKHKKAELKPESIVKKIDYLHTQAVAKHKEGKLEEAIAFYLESIEVDESQPAWIYGNVITLLAQVERFDEGLALGGKGKKLHPKSDEVYRAIGLVYDNKNDIENCIQKYQKAFSLNMKQPDWCYLNLGKNLLEINHFDEALEISKEGISYYPDYYYLHYTLGQALAYHEKWDEAIKAYRYVQENNPNFIEVEKKLNSVIYQKTKSERVQNNITNKNLELENLTSEPELKNLDKRLAVTPKDKLKNLDYLDIDSLFEKLQQTEIDFLEFKNLCQERRSYNLILNYGVWLGSSIIYLETTVNNFWVLEPAIIIVYCHNKYAIAKANFFQISEQQVVGIACFEGDIYTEDYGNYNVCLNYNNSLVLVQGEITQKAPNLEFIKYLQSKPDYQKHLIRESLSRSIISLVPEVMKPEAGSLLNKLQYFLDIPSVNYVNPNLPFKIFIDYIVPLKYEGVFISGWLQDPYDMLEEIKAISALGFTLNLSKEQIYRLERQDVNQFLKDTRYGNFEGKLGFCAYAEVPTAIRQSIQGFAELHSFRFLVRLKGNIEIEIIPDVKYSDFYNARRRVMQITSPDEVSEQMLANCIAPVGLKLQQLCTEQVKIKEVTVIGKATEQPLVSIIIPLYRRLDFLKIQFATMANDPTIKQCEIIYVLDSPEQEEELRSFLQHHCMLYQLAVTLVVMKRNSGYAAANNAGASQARGKYLVLLNSDVFAKTKGWVLKMADFYSSSPQIGALGAKLVYEDESLQHAGMFFAQTTFPFWITLHYYKGLPGNYPPAQKTRPVPAVTGACLMIRKELYDEVGGLTTDYVIGDFEDSDLCLKCAELGYESWYFADATLYHLERQSVPLNSVYNGSLAWRLNGRLHQERWGEQIAKLMSIHQ